MQKIYSMSEAQTLKIAQDMAKGLRAGDIVLLRGDLGAGKSVFARGLAHGYGVKGHVTSPTFTTMQQYAGEKGNFYHFDLYRMDDPEQLFETGLNEYIGTDGLAVIEWPENAALDPVGAYEVRVERVGEMDIPAHQRPVFGDDDQQDMTDGYARCITIIPPEEDER